nr:CDP-alcohol phosphatidyltransferase family protein [Aliagarivorans marinus]
MRSAGAAKSTARWLSQRNITPNEISMFSVVFAMLAALALLAWPHADGWSERLLPVVAAICIQGRLLCNLFDGMVAVEGGKHTPSGELFNDIPDRIADPIILIAAGYAVSSCSIAPVLGWSAALLAVLTAYIRTLATSIGAPSDFRGPMAKQHRMALVTGACLLSVVEPLFWAQGRLLLAALVVIVVGCVVTCVARARAAYRYMEQAHD